MPRFLCATIPREPYTTIMTIDTKHKSTKTIFPRTGHNNWKPQRDTMDFFSTESQRMRLTLKARLIIASGSLMRGEAEWIGLRLRLRPGAPAGSSTSGWGRGKGHGEIRGPWIRPGAGLVFSSDDLHSGMMGGGGRNRFCAPGPSMQPGWAGEGAALGPLDPPPGPVSQALCMHLGCGSGLRCRHQQEVLNAASTDLRAWCLRRPWHRGPIQEPGAWGPV